MPGFNESGHEGTHLEEGGGMKIKGKDKWSLEEEIRKIKSVSRHDGLKMIWDFVKSDHIDFGAFKILIGNIKGDDNGDQEV